MERYSVILWPLLAEVFAGLVVLSTRPQPEVELSVQESAGLSLVYIVLVFGMAVLMVYLVRRKMVRLIRIMIGIFFVYSTLVSLDTLISAFISFPWTLELLLSVAIAWLSFRRDLIGNLAKSLLSASLAYLFVVFFNDLFIYFLLGGLALYDAYSVFRGPLSELLMVSQEDPLDPLMVFYGDVSMGMGDVFCYSMAAAVSFRSLPIYLSILPLTALNAGILLTLWVLYRAGRSLPGLTIPISLWLPAQVGLLFLGS
ncbi:MAG: hypothetical protein QI197_00010 [Candidatus Korarchaeota archaeon]|nr:hypothetical protein [Candidatus Korarchaeota archaeon]